MWALRAAIRPAAWLSRVVLGRRAPRPAPPLLVCPERAFAAFHPGDLKGRGGGGRGPPTDDPRSRTGEVEEPEDAEDEEEEEEELLRRDPLLPVGTQRVCLVHPEVKWGPGKLQLTRADRQVAEAESLVHTLDRWSVVERMVVPARTPDGKVAFGRGTLRHLTEKIRALPEITAVFLNVERMAPPTKKELEAAWGVQVFDRFTVVLSIFRCNARTKEARLQVALAELPLLRRIAHAGATAPAEGQGAEDLKALDRLRDKRHLLGRQRRRREFPVVSMVGYTNCARGPSAPQDLVVHVRDVSRPETELQKASVPAALRGLRLPASLLDSVLEVHNKVDLVPGWLYQEATVQDVDVIPDAGAANVRVVISSSAYSKFRKLFLESASQ